MPLVISETRFKAVSSSSVTAVLFVISGGPVATTICNRSSTLAESFSTTSNIPFKIYDDDQSMKVNQN